jgi:hypothetical protein
MLLLSLHAWASQLAPTFAGHVMHLVESSQFRKRNARLFVTEAGVMYIILNKTHPDLIVRDWMSSSTQTFNDDRITSDIEQPCFAHMYC